VRNIALNFILDKENRRWKEKIKKKLINNKSFSLITCTMTPGFFIVTDINKAKTLFPYCAEQIHQFFDVPLK